jgi:anti-sigma-K factor RskA
VSERPIHDRLEELFAADAMGGLDEDGRHELHELLTWHDPHCPECARFRADYTEVAASMAMTLDPVPMSAGAEERLLTATRRTAQAMPGRVPRPASDVVNLDDAREERERRRGPAKVAVALLTAAACLVGAGLVGFWLRAPTTSTEAAVANFTKAAPTTSETLESGSEEVTVYYHPGQGDAALVVGHGMDDPPSGHVYELWYQPEGASTMAPAGVFLPEDGDVVAPAKVEEPFTTLAVSIEDGYNTSPEGEVVLTEKVTP